MKLSNKEKDEIDRNKLISQDKEKRTRIKLRCEEIYKIFNEERVNKDSLLYDFLNTEPYSELAGNIRSSTKSMTHMCMLFYSNEDDESPLFQAGSWRKIADLPKKMKRLNTLFSEIYKEIDTVWYYTADVIRKMRYMTKELYNKLPEDNDEYLYLHSRAYDYIYYSESEDGSRFVDWLKAIQKALIAQPLDLFEHTLLCIDSLIWNLLTLTRSEREASKAILERIKEDSRK